MKNKLLQNAKYKQKETCAHATNKSEPTVRPLSKRHEEQMCTNSYSDLTYHPLDYTAQGVRNLALES